MRSSRPLQIARLMWLMTTCSDPTPDVKMSCRKRLSPARHTLEEEFCLDQVLEEVATPSTSVIFVDCLQPPGAGAYSLVLIRQELRLMLQDASKSGVAAPASGCRNDKERAE